jgi:histidine ammonia-lyase
MAYYLGECIRGVNDAKKALNIQVNHSDDNPRVEINPERVQSSSPQLREYIIGKTEQNGAIYPTSNFESLPFTAPVKQLLQGLQGLSQAMCNQIIRFEDPKISHLPRYLIAPGSSGHGVGGIHYPVMALNNRNLMLSMPVPHTGIALAGQMEDMGTTGEISVNNLHKMNTNLERIASSQLLHAAQAIDLRGISASRLGVGTKDLYQQYRKVLPFIDRDRIFTVDMEKGCKVIKDFHAEDKL